MPRGQPGRGGPPPRGRRDEPEHPAERGTEPTSGAGPVQRAGRHFEIRKGRAGTPDEMQEEEGESPPAFVALPRSITQEQEEADLKKRLNRDELVDVNKRHASVRVIGAANAPSPLRRRSSGLWLLISLIAIAALLILADKYHLVSLLKR